MYYLSYFVASPKCDEAAVGDAAPGYAVYGLWTTTYVSDPKEQPRCPGSWKRSHFHFITLSWKSW